jgi:hypothetical protein
MTTFRIKVQTEALVTAYIEVEAATENEAFDTAPEQAREQSGNLDWKYDGLIEDASITASL